MDLRVFFFFFNFLVSLIIDVLRRRLGQGRRFGLNTETLQEMGIDMECVSCFSLV